MEVTADDLKFPKAVITRIIKDALPEGAKVSKEAQCAIARSAAIFILHATSLANENALSKRRKNVTAEDVLVAVRQLDCEELEGPVAEGFETFRQKKTDKQQRRSQQRMAKKREAEAKTNGKDDDEAAGESPETNDDEVVELSDDDEGEEGEEEEEEGEEDDVVELDEEE